MLTAAETLDLAKLHTCRVILLENRRVWEKHGIHLANYVFTCDNPPAELIAALAVHGETIRHDLPYDSES